MQPGQDEVEIGGPGPRLACVPRGTRMGCVICVSLLLVLVAYHLFVVLTLDLHHDEGWHLYASQLRYRGQLPYVDFAYFQMPLPPYVYGALQLLVGPSVLVGRLTSLMLSVIQAVLVVLIARRLAGDWAGVIALLCLAASPESVRVGSYANNVILGAVLGLLGTWGLSGDTTTRRAQTVAVGGWSLAVPARLSNAPALAFAAGVILWQNRRHLAGAWPALIVPLVVLGGGLGLFAFLDADRLYFNTVVAQMGRQAQLETSSALSGSVSDTYVLLATTLMYAPALAIIVLIGLVRVHRRCRGVRRSGYVGSCDRSGFLLIMALIPVVYAPNLVPGGLYTTYGATVYPLACIVAGWLAVRAWRDRSLQAPAVTALVGFSIAIGISTSVLYLPGITSWRSPGLRQLERISATINEAAGPSDRLLTFETALAANTGRDVVTGAAMSYFSYFPRLTTEQAIHYRVLNPALLSRRLSNHEANLVLFTDFDIHLTRKSPVGWRSEPVGMTQSDILDLFPEMAEQYALAETVDDYGPWHNHLYIFTSAR